MINVCNNTKISNIFFLYFQLNSRLSAADGLKGSPLAAIHEKIQNLLTNIHAYSISFIKNDIYQLSKK